jgi:hypothetical protein
MLVQGWGDLMAVPAVGCWPNANAANSSGPTAGPQGWSWCGWDGVHRGVCVCVCVCVGVGVGGGGGCFERVGWVWLCRIREEAQLWFRHGDAHFGLSTDFQRTPGWTGWGGHCARILMQSCPAVQTKPSR